MSGDNLHSLQALGAAADVPTFLHLIKSYACVAVIRHMKDSNERRQLQGQGYSALVLAALSKGLQLYNNAAAGQLDSSPGAGVCQDLQQLVDCLGTFTLAVNSLLGSRLRSGSPEATLKDHEVLDSGAHWKTMVC